MAFSRILLRKSFCKLFTKHLWWISFLAKFYDFDIFLWAHLDGWSEGWKLVINESCKSFLGNKRTKSNASSCFSIWRTLNFALENSGAKKLNFLGLEGKGWVDSKLYGKVVICKRTIVGAKFLSMNVMLFC